MGILVLGIKYTAYRVTGSVSLYSDALESIVNTIAAVGMLFALRLAAQPPDRNHPFGHTKVEYFSAVLEGALILYAAIEIMRGCLGTLRIAGGSRKLANGHRTRPDCDRNQRRPRRDSR